jgi:hypothetical protein
VEINSVDDFLLTENICGLTDNGIDQEYNSAHEAV